MKDTFKSVSPVPIPPLTAHNPSPNGHEVEDVGHSGAVAQEAADADLEHDGDHQDPVPAGGRRGRLRTKALRSWGPDGKQGTAGSKEVKSTAGYCRVKGGQLEMLQQWTLAPSHLPFG